MRQIDTQTETKRQRDERHGDRVDNRADRRLEKGNGERPTVGSLEPSVFKQTNSACVERATLGTQPRGEEEGNWDFASGTVPPTALLA